VSGGLIMGPSLGGILISQWGWRTIFLANLPVGTLGFFLVLQAIPHRPPKKPFPPFDWLGVFLQGIGLFLFVLALDPPHSIEESLQFIPFLRPFMVFLALLTFWFFIRVESRATAPVFDLELLRIRTFWTANLASFLVFVLYSSIAVLMPFYLEEILLIPTTVAGYVMTAIPVMIFVIAPFSGRVSDRLGSQELSTSGAFLGAITAFLMAGAGGFALSEDTSIFRVAALMGTLGLALGLFQTPNNNAIMGHVPKDKLGIASALLATVRNLGLVTGTGLATAIFTWHRAETGSFIESLHLTYALTGGVGLAATVASLAKRRGPYWKNHG